MSGESLQILHFTDIHGAGFLFDEIGNDLRKADLILLSGDITHFGKKDEAREIISKISAFNKHIFAVAGNCDHPEVEDFLNETRINLHRKIRKFRSFTIAGMGGSIPCPGTTPLEYTEEVYKKWFNELSENLTDENLIFVCHQPPLNTINDQVSEGMHVGSSSVRDFIIEKRPMLFLTGHIHEGAGSDFLHNSTILNPGPFRKGKFASIILSGENDIQITLRQITV